MERTDLTQGAAGSPEEATGAQATGAQAGRSAPRSDVSAGLRALARTAGHGLVQGLASATGGAVVAALVWWCRR